MSNTITNNVLYFSPVYMQYTSYAECWENRIICKNVIFHACTSNIKISKDMSIELYFANSGTNYGSCRSILLIRRFQCLIANNWYYSCFMNFEACQQKKQNN
ncbi:hypothetical protein T11_18116 [Trichinella zimbabwensis]|uniref:Uncharacterized protein n=1 Tax=Trichinella zimbabwensis TaxID=268475 RepID=A0A0V1H2D4_9BILA|nr:hypothetical protein T11_18116 [Trichinella zimbabwensis]